MDTYWFNKLIETLEVQTNSENEKLMVLHLDKEIKKLKLKINIDAAGNVIVTKGKSNTYPCVVSHMDTVHNFVPNFGVYRDIDNKDLLFALNDNDRVGIGGDDKCGVFACLYLLDVIPQIKVVFFSREEVGCQGSKNIDKKFFSDCRYIIQLDRKNNRDFIQTYYGKKTVSHEFSSEIGEIKKRYKYKNATGTVTDVMRLWNDKVGISCINLSCGYHQPHTNYEYISISNLWHSVKFTEDIVNTMQPKIYKSLPPPPVVVKSSYNTYTGNIHKQSQCAKCKLWKKDFLLYDVGGEKWCWECKKTIDSNKESKKNDNTIEFTCFNCGKFGTLDRYGKHLYCKKCASFIFPPDSTSEVPHNNNKPVSCEMCNKIILPEQPITIIEDVKMCSDCAALWNEDTEKQPKQCYVCNKIIPKDHKIIYRFGVQVCEDCALPSDTTAD